MASRIEDYALLSDMHTAPLIGRDGSIDWLCFPRFDSPSAFGALLGTEDNGRWLLAPAGASTGEATVVERRYLGSTFVLQTRWESAAGSVLMTEFMPVGDRRASVVRRVEGLSGEVSMYQELKIRYGYSTVVPWIHRPGEAAGGPALSAIAGPDAMVLRGEHLPKASDHRHSGKFTVAAGETTDLELTWFPSHRPIPPLIDVDAALAETIAYWDKWASKCLDQGEYFHAVRRSLLVLRALTHEDTGGIVAAATTSLPEDFGGSRNWDYRFCWLRDAALTLEAMLIHGYGDEALKWRNWLLRAVAGDPDDLQIMYGVAGERNLPEAELTHFAGYEGATPVRIGNGAVNQYQGDVVGEVLVALQKLRSLGVKESNFSWPLQRKLLGFVEKHLDEKDHGLWEMRGALQYFTHSRVMMWAAMDCGVRAVREHGLPGPVEKWEKIRDQLQGEIMERGFNKQLNSFTQTYDGTEVDASLLQLPQVGFLSYNDEKMYGTVARLEKDLLNDDGLLMRYRTEANLDGLAGEEHPFLACSFWLVEQYARAGRADAARRLMDQLVGYSNEVGLLSEEYSTKHKRMAGNFPQAFSHLALVRAADALHGLSVDTGARPQAAVS